jgi:alpha-ketoglutarate-dependent taurine dioxygenase
MGARLLARLEEHATQERFIYCHRWQPGDNSLLAAPR